MAELTVIAAEQILQPYNCTEPKLPASTAEAQSLRSALLTLAAASDYQILGICADNLDQGLRALRSYRQALGYTEPVELPTGELDLPVYLKFNPQNNRCYLDRYVGTHRGVLVSCQSFTEDGFNQTIGHLPLDLFGE
jgi:hypothetical protein